MQQLTRSTAIRRRRPRRLPRTPRSGPAAGAGPAGASGRTTPHGGRAPDLRRSRQHAGVEPEGRRIREQDRRAHRQGVERQARVRLVAGAPGILLPRPQWPVLRRGPDRSRRGWTWPAPPSPTFRSGYVVVYRKDSGLDLKSLDDPAWKKLKIGVNLLNSDAENTPPAMALSRHGVVGNLVGFTHLLQRAGPARRHREGRRRQEGGRVDRVGSARGILRPARRRSRW